MIRRRRRTAIVRLLFVALAEITFRKEFSTRFDFIAIDYLA
ncbi:MAG: hypothetical protein ABIO63_09120 [Casimicrobiaceae bacterium]